MGSPAQPQIFVFNETGVANVDPNDGLPPSLRAAIEEVRHPDAQPTYKQARKPWVSSTTEEADKASEFNPNTYITVQLHLKELENLKTSSVDSVGDYMVKVMFMGETFGNFLSGTVNLDSLAFLTYHVKTETEIEDPTETQCPSINLELTVNLNLRYVDLLDNPLILSVTLVKDFPSESYHSLEPFGYLTMDVLSLIRSGMPMGLRAPWVLIPERIPLDRVYGMPFLSGDILGCRGLPNHEQQKRGNIMSIVMESMYRLPKELQNMTHGPSTSIEVYVSLPNCSDGTHFLFPGGEFRKIIVCDSLEVDQDTVIEVPPFDEVGIPIFIQDDQCFHRHWASVPDYYPDVPWGATAILNSKCIPTDKEQLVGDMTSGTGDSSWKGYLDSNDARIVWNSLHRHYLGVEAYKEMLDRLSKHTIWPMEVAVTTRKERIVAIERPSRRSLADSAHSKPSKSSWFEETVNDITVIYHGVAFIDMTALLYPGAKSARFAARLYPYDEALFMARSCSAKSAFLTTLSNYQSVNNFGKTQKSLSKSRTKSADEHEAGRETANSNTSNSKEKKKIGEEKKSRRSAERTKKHGAPTVVIKDKEKPTSSKSTRNLSSLTSGGNVGARLNLTTLTEFPFIICQINLKRAMIPDVKDKEKKPSVSYVPTRKFPRKRLINSSNAAKLYRRAVLEASAELSQEFNVEYMNEIVKGGVSKGIMNHANSGASYENVKKGFLFYLNASGRYLVLREHLRQAVSELIQQKCIAANPGGFKNQRNFQNFLHDVYMYMVDEMHETLNMTSFKEMDAREDVRQVQKHGHLKDEEVRSVTNLFRFAEEAFAQCDYENCHRIHIERIARSNDASACWTDFAIMWLSRGDDRLAEIAIREALATDPMNLVALVIAGVIAGTHRDHRAVTCLGLALTVRPLCPEIMVLLGAVHSNLGNDMASEYFYKKARFVHHLLTGRDTTAIALDFKNISQEWKTVSDAATNFESLLASGLTVTQEGFVAPDVPPKHASPTSNHGTKEEAQKSQLNSSPTMGKRKSPRGSKDRGHGSKEDISRRRAHSKDSGRNRSRSKDHRPSFLGDHPIVPDPTNLSSSSKEQMNNLGGGDGQSQRPVFEFAVEIDRHNVHMSKPPVLNPCLMVTWNVTKISRGRKVQPEMQYHEKLPNVLGKGRKAKRPAQGDILDEFNRILALDNNTDRVIENAEDEDDNVGATADADEDVDEEEDELEMDDSDKSIELTKRHGRLKLGHKHPRHRGQRRSRDQRDRTKDIGHQAHHLHHHHRISHVSEGGEHDSDHVRRAPSRRKVFSKRVGSEYLWTAHLLLKLRLFDFLDGILAREIAIEGRRTVGFLYIRAMSLHLRGRDKEALEFVHEAILSDPENGVLWTLRGHCYYNMRESDEALLSYEKVLSLPHGREDLHLVYLRFGALCLEKNNAQLAKRVFLKRVHVCPTPYMWLAIGNTCYHLKQLDEAESAFAEANRLDTTNPVIWAHLSLVSLALGHQTLAEQSYKWAIRFGLKKCALMDEIKGLHRELGYGNPAFPRIPHVIPHEYYIQRLGRERPFEMYTDALNFPNIAKPKLRFANSAREEELINRLHQMYTEEKQKEFEDKVAELMNKKLSDSSDGISLDDSKPGPVDEEANMSKKGDKVFSGSGGGGAGGRKKTTDLKLSKPLLPIGDIGKPPLPHNAGRRRSSGVKK